MFKTSRKLAAVSSGFVGAAILIGLGSVPASTDELKDVKVDIADDSYSSDEGITGTCFGPEDPRHRSPYAAGAQAMQRVQDSDMGVRVDGATGASSGATTKNFFEVRRCFSSGPVINTPQRDQIRPDVDAVTVGSGGDDARFTEVLTNSVTSVSDAIFERSLKNLRPLLNSRLSDEKYKNQAANFQPGEASMVTARLLQTLQALQQRAPGVKLVVPKYPLALDPNVKEPFCSGFSRHELERIQKFVSQLNAAMAKAVEVCGCAELADVSMAMKGREVCTENPVLTDLGVRFRSVPDMDMGTGSVPAPEKGASVGAAPALGRGAATAQLPPRVWLRIPMTAQHRLARLLLLPTPGSGGGSCTCSYASTLELGPVSPMVTGPSVLA